MTDTPRLKPLRLSLALLSAAALSAGVAHRAETAAPEAGIGWKKVVLDKKFRSEGVSVADVNRDGRLDILAGSHWYEAPNWTPHVIAEARDLDPANSYSPYFHSFALDVDRDGWTDQIVVGFPGGRGSWMKNPGRSGGLWTDTEFHGKVGNESPIFMDINRDKRPDLVFGKDSSVMSWWEAHPQEPTKFRHTLVSPSGERGAGSFAHGLGVGDMNKDGRVDILTKDGYYLAPKDPKTSPWTFVPANLGPDSAHMHAHDFDGDGDMDVISSSAHNIGVWWHEQIEGGDKPQFRQHTIDDSFSQAHAMVMADLNGDKQPDFITGKRKWAHGPTGDVNPNDPFVLYWYEYRRTKDGKVDWIRHTIDAESESGVGTQFTVTDVNRDRRPDIVVSNKNGVFLFEQTRTGGSRDWSD